MTHHLYIHLHRLALLLLFMVSSLTLTAEDSYDSLEISLLTCAPHDQVYSLYGHTAIRLQDKSQGYDMVVNYGLFDSSAPHFVLRFVFGLTDYCMGITSFEMFRQEDVYYGSEVVQQRLNLTEAEKANIMEAIRVNALPENLEYRYNYFYDNCTTRARDMLANHLSGKVRYQSQLDPTITFRQMVHSCNVGHPWSKFGNDMLLGVQADMPTSREEQQFLPRNLKQDFSTAVIEMNDGSSRKLIEKEEVVVPKGVQQLSNGFPLSPMACSLIVLTITIFVTVMEWYRKKNIWLYDALLMIATGLAGILLFLMLFSVHPTVRFNLQLLLLNPLPLFFFYPVVKRLRHGQSHIWWKIGATLIILFFIGRFFQNYAEGMLVLALSLLIRCISHITMEKNQNAKLGKADVQKPR